jgi:predicted metalloprotease with PDZ domain
MQCSKAANVAASSSTPTEDMDFLGNGSMMDLVMKMGDLDRVLDEISQIDTNGQKSTTNFSDDVVDIDDSEVGSVALVQMQRELLLAEQRTEESPRRNREGNLPPSTSRFVMETAEKGKLVTAVAVKPSQDCLLGIRMKKSNGVTMIVNIRDTGLLNDSDLRPGMELVSINDEPIKNAKHAKGLIQGSSARVKIVARV